MCFQTCLSTWEEYRRSEMSDCTPHITLFLSGGLLQSYKYQDSELNQLSSCCGDHYVKKLSTADETELGL